MKPYWKRVVTINESHVPLGRCWMFHSLNLFFIQISVGYPVGGFLYAFIGKAVPFLLISSLLFTDAREYYIMYIENTVIKSIEPVMQLSDI